VSVLTRPVRRYPITVFALLACLFGWGIYIAAALGAGSHPDNMPLGPLLAALVVTACQGREQLRAWGRRLRQWSSPPWWYAVAVLTPIAVDLGIVLVNHLFGAPLPTGTQWAGWTSIPGFFVIMLVMVGIGEEAGWTAFAGPVLLRRHGLFGAWAVLATVRILWHLPLLLSGEMPWVMGIVGNAAFQLVLLRVLQASGGRWSLAAVWHATLNAFGGGFFFPMVTGPDRERLGLLLAAGYVLVAAAALTHPPRRLGATTPDSSTEGPSSRVVVASTTIS
jgi:membrane protease YdiL (CAAX protease family)